jgi:hypothetical protein
MRQTLRCVLVHASPDDCFEWNRKAQKIMGGGFRNHPKLPACTGDGKKAKRLVMLSDGKAEYQDIPCPNFCWWWGDNHFPALWSIRHSYNKGNFIP